MREPPSSENKNAHRAIRAAQIKQRHRGVLRAYPNVIGLGVGLKKVGGRLTGEVALRVYVSKKVPRHQLAKDSILPTVIDGIPVDVIQKRSRSYQAVLDHQSRRAVVMGGISVINVRFLGSGTLGCAVYDNFTGQQMILSNWHVLATSLTAQQNERIIQPGSGGGDTGTYGDIVARLTRSVLSSELDAAVATLSCHRFCTDDLLGLGRVNPTPVGATLNMAVSKSGRSTGVTHGTISDLDADFDVDYSPLGLGTRHCEHQLVIDNDGFSAPGDSGSVIVDQQNRPVALLFAGGEGGTDGNPILSVIDALDINFGPSTAPQDLMATLISLP